MSSRTPAPARHSFNEENRSPFCRRGRLFSSRSPALSASHGEDVQCKVARPSHLPHVPALWRTLKHKSDRGVGAKLQQLVPLVVFRLSAGVCAAAIHRSFLCFVRAEAGLSPKGSSLSSEDVCAATWCVRGCVRLPCVTCDTEATQHLTSTYSHSGFRCDKLNRTTELNSGAACDPHLHQSGDWPRMAKRVASSWDGVPF